MRKNRKCLEYECGGWYTDKKVSIYNRSDAAGGRVPGHHAISKGKDKGI